MSDRADLRAMLQGLSTFPLFSQALFAAGSRPFEGTGIFICGSDFRVDESRFLSGSENAASRDVSLFVPAIFRSLDPILHASAPVKGKACGVALGVGIPSLLESMTSLYLLAVEGRLSFNLREQFDAELVGVRETYEGLKYYWDQGVVGRLDRAMVLIGVALEHFNFQSIIEFRRSREQAPPIPALILQAADEVLPYDACQKVKEIKQRLLSP